MQTYPERDIRGKILIKVLRLVRERRKEILNVSACEQVKSYLNEEFIVRSNKLFCHACKEVLALKISSREYHIKSQKHISGKKKLALASKEESRIQKALLVYDSRTH